MFRSMAVEVGLPFEVAALRLLQFGEDGAVVGALLSGLRTGLHELLLRVFEHSGDTLALLIRLLHQFLHFMDLSVDALIPFLKLLLLEAFVLVLQLLQLLIVLLQMVLNKRQFVNLYLLFVQLRSDESARQ